jgi:hypothetical protein
MNTLDYTGPEFFTMMQIPMLLGRETDERNRPGDQGQLKIRPGTIKTPAGRQGESDASRRRLVW